MDVEVFFLNMYRDMMVADLEHDWYFNCGRCSTPSYLVAIIVIILWYIWPNRFGSLSLCVSCLISVVAYIGSKENVWMLNVSHGS
jgi:hypothetical protein